MTARALFVLVAGLEGSDVRDEKFGDGVHSVKMRKADIDAIYEQNRLNVSKWEFYHSGFTHAVVNEYDSESKNDHDAEQEILRAFIALRIVRPSPLALRLVVRAKGMPPETAFHLQNRVGIHSASYISDNESQDTITIRDVRRALVMWPNIQKVFQNWSQHKRLVRAIRFFDVACSNFDGQVRHVLFHSCLECILCTAAEHVGQQLVQLLARICPEASRKDINAIAKTRGSYVHSVIIPCAQLRDAAYNGEREGTCSWELCCAFWLASALRCSAFWFTTWKCVVRG